jgi:hypothetical protein
MEIKSNPNISPLEVEIENKVTSAYLISIATRFGNLSIREQFLNNLQDPSPVINQIKNNKTNQNGN